MPKPTYQALIGLEVHVALSTVTKMFCRCPAKFGDPPNTNVCPVCLGLPGSLPNPNGKAVWLGAQAAIALDAEISLESSFDRKSYFYPDLPKGYQITQFRTPLARNGHIQIENPDKKIGIRQIHLEEDTGKSVHAGDDIMTAEYSLVDFNRSGVPLIEIVSEPDMSSPDEARQYLEHLQKTLVFAKVSDAKMEEGSMRVDCNISVSRLGDPPGTPVEVKNLSSIRAVVRALSYEFERQKQLLEDGQPIFRETRHWDEAAEVTVSMRSKESTEGFRYLPEPDLPGILLTAQFVEQARKALPQLPKDIVRRYVEDLGLTLYDAGVLTLSPHLSGFFDECIALEGEPKAVANWIMGDLLGYMNANGIPHERIPVSPERLASLLSLVGKGAISGKIAKEVLVKVIQTGKDPSAIVKEEGLEQVSDDAALLKAVRGAIESNPAAVQDYRDGKGKALGFLVGQVMKATRGRANPAKVNALLRDELSRGRSVADETKA